MTGTGDDPSMTQKLPNPAELPTVLERYAAAMQCYAGALFRQDWTTAEEHRNRAERLYEILMATLVVAAG